MKNLANCTPREFLIQTNRIKRSVEKWLQVTEVLKIRKTLPDMKATPEDATDQERAEIAAENRKRTREQVWKNFSRIFDVCMEEHVDETLEILALLCFVDPKEVNDYPVSEYLKSVSEMLDNEEVIGFFTSLSKWVRLDISN